MRDYDSPAEQERIAKLQELIAEELPELIEKGERLHDAAQEDSLSGELRRSIHASRVPLTHIARDIQASSLDLDRFLTGEGTLPSDVIDRLVKVLGYEFDKTPRTQAS